MTIDIFDEIMKVVSLRPRHRIAKSFEFTPVLEVAAYSAGSFEPSSSVRSVPEASLHINLVKSLIC